MHLRDGDFYADVPPPSDWAHIVLNYNDSSEGGGVGIYLDLPGSTWIYLSPGEGRVVVGRAYTNLDVRYASVDIDELSFFNGKLNDEYIKDIFNMY